MSSKIQANISGSRHLDIEEHHLLTIRRFRLLDNLVDSNGVVDEEVVDKLKYKVRSLLESDCEHKKELLDLCLDVIYHHHMKAYGLNQLIGFYQQWLKEHPAEVSSTEIQTEENPS